MRKCVRECLEDFEEMIDLIITNADKEDFEEFKRRVIERLNEVDWFGI